MEITDPLRQMQDPKKHLQSVKPPDAATAPNSILAHLFRTKSLEMQASYSVKQQAVELMKLLDRKCIDVAELR